jgi:transmembrane sensor
VTGASAREEAAAWWSRMRGPDAEASRAEFEAWHAASPLHASEYAEIEKIWALAAGLEATRIGRARSLPPRPRLLAWATPPRLVLAAAAMVVAALLATLWPSARSMTGPTAIAHATRVGEIRTIALPDGSSVILDTDSRLQVRFDDNVRMVTLERGRARFDVKADPARIFLVASGGRTVSADGSGFDVQLTPQGLCVLPLRGALEVRPRQGEAAGGALRVVPGQLVRFGAAGAPQTEPAGKGRERWVEGMLVFHGAPLSAVLAETNRYTGRPIRLSHPGLGTLTVTGAFRPVPADRLAASLGAAFGLEVRRDAAGGVLLAPKAHPPASEPR